MNDHSEGPSPASTEPETTRQSKITTLVINFGLDCMVPETKDRLIAPKISQFNEPQIPEVKIYSRSLIDIFAMNIDLSLVLKNCMRQAVFNLARKAEDALNEYIEGRDAALRFTSGDGQSFIHYFSSLRHFEHCLTHLRQAIDCYWVISGQKPFEKGDGSVLERAATLRDKIHHLRSVIETSEVKDEASFQLFVTRQDGNSRDKMYDLSSTSNVPVWLTNSGIECSDAVILFSELAKELTELHSEAETCVKMKPPIRSC